MKTGRYLSLVFLMHGLSYGQIRFQSFEEVMAYAKEKNTTLQSEKIKVEQAEKARKIAKLAVLDPTVTSSSSFINNTRLPVNVFPAEALGGVPGTFREIRTGVQYNTSSNQTVDLKLLNPVGWQDLKLAKVNLSQTETNLKINTKSVFENLASVYFNILLLEAQKATTSQNLKTADTLLAVATQKHNHGIGRPQDVNDCKINQVNLQENLRQLEFQMVQQTLGLKNLLAISDSTRVEIIPHPFLPEGEHEPEVKENPLQILSYGLQEKSLLITRRKNRFSTLPTLSLVGNNSYNQYNQDFTVFGGRWIHSQYVGLRLSIALPDANTIGNRYNLEYDQKIALNQFRQAKTEAGNQQKQLKLEWEKAKSQAESLEEIVRLQKDSFQRNRNLYQQGVLSIDRLLTSQNAVISAEYNVLSAQINRQLAQTKIDIHNNIQ